MLFDSTDVILEEMPGDRLQRFKAHVNQRFSSRIHMTLILNGVILSGVCSSHFLYVLDVRPMIWRYPLSIAFSYLSFYLLVRLWLFYISGHLISRARLQASSELSDSVLDLPSGSSARGASSAPTRGGSFSGAGATGTWGVGIKDSSAASGSGSSGGGLSIDSDSGGALVVLVVLGLALLLLLGSGVYLIYSGPEILGEVAFQFAIATGMVRRTRLITQPESQEEWFGRLFRKTVIPFALVLLMSLGLGWSVQHYYPGVHTMKVLVEQLQK